MEGHEITFQSRSQIDAAGFEADHWLGQWQRTWSQIACGAGLAMGCFLLWRRFDGGLQHPLPRQALLAVGLALVATAAVIRHFWRDDPPSLLSGRRVLPALMVIAVGVAVSLAGTNELALFAFWGLLAATESLSLFRTAVGDRNADVADAGDSLDEVDDFGGQSVTDVAEVESAGGKQESPVTGLANDNSVEGNSVEGNSVEGNSVEFVDMDVIPDVANPVGDESLGSLYSTGPIVDEAEEEGQRGEGEVLQRLLRTRDADGQEVLFGELRADFAVGDRLTRLHVAFCPPLDQPPQVYAEATSFDERLGSVTVKVAQVLVLGTRIDVELESPAKTAGAVQVEFYATADE